MTVDPDITIKWAIKQVIKYSPLPYEELYQIGYEGYLTAVVRNDRDYFCLKYAKLYILGYMKEGIRQEFKYIPASEYEVASLITPPPREDIELTPYLKIASSKLENREHEVIHRMYLNDDIASEQELADEWQLNARSINNIKRSGIEQLKEIFIPGYIRQSVRPSRANSEIKRVKLIERYKNHNLEQIKQAIQTLEPIYREILQKHYFEDQRLIDLSEALSLTQGSTRSRKCVALKKLDEKLHV